MRTVASIRRNQSRWRLVIGSCGLALCMISLLVSSFVIYQQSDNSPYIFVGNVISTTVTIEATQTSTSQPRIVTSTDGDVVSAQSSDPTIIFTLTTPSARPHPYFDPICFKAITGQSQLPTCGTVFEANIRKVQAIFNYAHMIPNHHEWTRIWYHNGQEVLRIKEKWTGETSGQFDYSLDTNDNQPFAAGNWELELYIDNQLEAYGGFVIQQLAIDATFTPIPTLIFTPTATPISTYRLAYTKWDGHKHAIWIADLNGRNQHFLLDFAASPSWSPNGQKLAFYGEEGIDSQASIGIGTNGVWVIDANGQNPTQLVPEGSGRTVTWSLNSDTIAFSAARGGPDRRIYFVDSSGTILPYETLGEYPSLSPDGSQVVVKACRPSCGLWLSNRDGSEALQLTNAGTDGLPAWSPNGRQIAFSRNVDGNVDIYVIRLDTRVVQRLTQAPGNDSVPAWTPDNRQIVFRSTRNGLWQIFIMNVDGTNQRMIIDKVGGSNEWAFERMSVR